MIIFRMAAKYLVQSFRRPIALILLAAGPIVLMLVLAQAFSGIFYEGAQSLQLTVGYYAEEQGVLYAAFKEFARSLAAYGVVCEETTQPEAAEKMTADGAYHAFIRIEERLLELFLNNNSGIRSGIVENLLNGFISRLNFTDVVIKHNAAAAAVLLQETERDYVQYAAFSGAKQPRAIDYFGITILTMAVLYGAYLASAALVKERDGRTLYRIRTAPVTKLQYLCGAGLGLWLVLMLQVTVVFLFAKIVLRIEYGTDFFSVAVLLAAESFFALALGMGAANFYKDSKAANAVLNILPPVLVFLGGGYMKLPDSQIMNFFTQFSPVSWVNKALFETIYGTGPGTGRDYFWPALLFCFAAGLVLLGVSTLRSVRREEV